MHTQKIGQNQKFKNQNNITEGKKQTNKQTKHT